MSLTKYAKAEIVGVKSSGARIKHATLDKFASYDDYRTDDGYLYVRVRAISSRVNKNHDGWPSTELQKSWETFKGKPIFVDHHNTDPSKARGVIVDASVHVADDIAKVAALDPYYASAPEAHLPPTHIELLLEVDAKSFPKLAKAIIDDDIDSVSMGANVERSVCSHCDNEARNPDEFCDHVRAKGALFEKTDKHGRKTATKSYEDCYDIGFFEISFVFDPADTTALVEKDSLRHAKVAAAVHAEVGDQMEINVLDFGSQSAVDSFLSDVKTAMVHGICAGCGSPTSGAELCDTCTAGQQNMVPGQQQGLVPSPTNGTIPGRLAFTSEAAADEFTKTADEYNHPEAWTGSEPAAPDPLTGNGATVGDTVKIVPTPEDIRRSPQHYKFGPPYGWGDTGTIIEDRGSDWVVDRFLPEWHNDQSMTGVKIVVPKRIVQVVDPQVTTPDTVPQDWDHAESESETLVRNAKTADRHNPPPQGDMQTAPDKVDTLRQELTCPVCGSTMEDGVCEVCNHEEPPEGFDNPDLTKAREVDEEMRQQESEQAALETGAEGQTPGDAPVTPDSAQPQGPGQAMASTTSTPSPSRVISDGHKTAAGEQNSGRINTKERPLLPPTRQTSDKPSNVQVVTDHHKPVESSIQGADMSEQHKTADGTVATDPDKRVDPEGSGAAISDVSPDKVVDVTGTGGFLPVKEPEHQSVDKAVTVTGEPTKTWSEDKGTNPVNPDVGDFNTVKSNTEKDAAKVPGPDVKDMPDTLDVTKPIGAEGTVGDGTKTWSENHNADPVTPEASPNTVNLHGAAVAEGRRHALACIKLAEAEIEVGVTELDAKFDRIAELEDESVEAIEAQIGTLSKVKTAGLRKPVLPKRVANAGRVPSLRGGGIRTAAAAPTEIDPDGPEGDAGLFL